MARLASLAAIFSLTLIFPTAAAAIDKTLLIIKGGQATADFSSVDSTGCVTTAVHIDVGEDTTKDTTWTPEKTSSLGAYVTLSQIDQCNATERSAIGFTQDILFQVDNRLTVATVRGPITFCNSDSTACFDTALDLTWVGTGDLIDIESKYKTVSGGFKMITHLKGDLRLAVARSNLYDADGVTNLTPDASTSAFIAQANTHTVTIVRVSDPDPDDP